MFKPNQTIRMKEDCGGKCYPKKGDTCVLKNGDENGDYTDKLFAHGDAEHSCICQNLWELIQDKTWETLEQGDVIQSPQGKNRIVQGMIGEIVFYVVDDEDRESDFNSITALKRAGFTILQPECPTCGQEVKSKE